MKALSATLPTTVLVLALALPATAAEEKSSTSSPSAAVDFQSTIEPILHQRCYVCHGASLQMNGLRLDRKQDAFKGGYSGAAIVAGDSAASKLLERITSDKEGFRMPPAGPSLSEAEIAALKSWIDGGAVWPDSAPAPQPTEQEKQTHWSFQPVKSPEPPQVKKESWVRNPIDRFVLAKLEAEGVEPSPDADKITLIRRASFDLTGLPPAPEEVDRFVADDRPEAYGELVDRLLRSPHYGERQAIHWLDAARYADSDGYERDPLRPHAWRWRQWVINALNDDMPFDQFTIEQVAGDLLPDAKLEAHVATGFLRNGVKNREAGVKNGQKRFEEVLDRATTIGTVWLGLTTGCAQCHDHKYDPLSQQDLYSMFAVFNNAVERNIEAPLPGEIGPYLRSAAEYRAKRQAILEKSGIPEMQAAWRQKIIATMDDPGVNLDWDFFLTEWRAAHDRSDWWMRADPEQLNQIERDELTDWFVRGMGSFATVLDLGPGIKVTKGLKEQFKKVSEDLQKLEEQYPAVAHAYVMIERDRPVATHIMLKGDWRSPGIEVQPRPPAVLHEFRPGGKPVRLAFAEWLVSKENPLTPRVTANRMWQELFGRGLVRTTDDFGTQGAKPSHPQLVDWLASEFVESGWSRKHMLRLIVTSAAYRQDSAVRQDLAERDPGNQWLARQNRLRLPAELIRDTALSASGLLYPKIGGPSVRPPQPAGVTELMYSEKPWEAETGPERYRRGLYIFFQRTAPYPMLVNFDAPTTLVTSVRRERSNSPLQALNLLNDEVFMEASQALAVRVVEEQESFNGRLERMFRLCLSRRPKPREAERIAAYFETQKQIFDSETKALAKVVPYVPEGAEPLEIAAWTGVARGLMNLDEFVTRE